MLRPSGVGSNRGLGNFFFIQPMIDLRSFLELETWMGFCGVRRFFSSFFGISMGILSYAFNATKFICTVEVKKYLVISYLLSIEKELKVWTLQLFAAKHA